MIHKKNLHPIAYSSIESKWVYKIDPILQRFHDSFQHRNSWDIVVRFHLEIERVYKY